MADVTCCLRGWRSILDTDPTRPIARLAHLVAELSGVEYEKVEVDLSKAEQFSPEFVAVSPLHQVPVLEDQGVNMTQSRDICKLLMDQHSTSPANDHWYPAEPAQREEVDAWMEWSRPMHRALGTAVVMARMGPQQGMPFREHYGFFICILGAKARNSQAEVDLWKNMEDAEELVGKRKITCVEDLNLGDLATFMEVSLPMECHKDFLWSNFPNLKHLYKISSKVPHFEKVHQPFLDFCEMYRHHRDAGTTATWADVGAQVIQNV